MILLALLVTFLVVVLTGPAGVEWREKRRARLDAPAAKVLYLPSASCQSRSGSALENEREEDALRAELRDRVEGCAAGRECVWCDERKGERRSG